jgi:hypothetical protein
MIIKNPILQQQLVDLISAGAANGRVPKFNKQREFWKCLAAATADEMHRRWMNFSGVEFFISLARTHTQRPREMEEYRKAKEGRRTFLIS